MHATTVTPQHAVARRVLASSPSHPRTPWHRSGERRRRRHRRRRRFARTGAETLHACGANFERPVSPSLSLSLSLSLFLSLALSFTLDLT